MLSLFSRLTINGTARNTRCISMTPLQAIKITPILMAEPLKKKKKLDPAIIKQREDRKKKKIEKQIRRLEKNARQLKPIDENEVSLVLLDEKEKRNRSINLISEDEKEKRVLLHKQWSRYKLNTKVLDMQLIDYLRGIQDKALDELRKESEELYQKAIQPDLALTPFTCEGPVATPPIQNYDSPDGEYIDITRKWE